MSSAIGTAPGTSTHAVIRWQRRTMAVPGLLYFHHMEQLPMLLKLEFPDRHP